MKLECDRKEYRTAKEKAMWATLITIFIILVIACILFIGIDIGSKKLIISRPPAGKVIQKTCLGKLVDTYQNCSNIRDEEGFVCFDVSDPNIDADSIMIRGGIIKVEIQKGE